jgi:hypothetical protein
MTDLNEPTRPGEPGNRKPDQNEAPAKRQPLHELLPLPGLAAIALYLFLLAGVIIVGVVEHYYPALFLVFSACFLTAGAGLMLLLRWAWAMALAAVLLLACYNLWLFTTVHLAPSLIQGLLNFVFFLYMIRTEVRERLR